MGIRTFPGNHMGYYIRKVQLYKFYIFLNP